MAAVKVKHIMACLADLAPEERAMEYDNVGLLVGSKEDPVSKVMVGLELTEGLLDEAIQKSCDMIVVHHPLIFKPIKKVIQEDIVGKKIIRLIRSNIALYASHTNLDEAKGGLNDFIASKIGIQCEQDLDSPSPIRLGYVQEQTVLELASHIKKQLKLNYIHYCGEESHLVSKVALCTGSGMSFYKEALQEGIDAYITGDLKYHEAMEALDLNTPVIDATHFGSEVMVAELLYEWLEKRFDKSVELVIHEGAENPIKIV